MAATGQENARSEEIQEIWNLFKEAGQRLKETEEMLAESVKETDRRFKETDRQFKETNRGFRATKMLVDNLTGKWGKFVEGMVAPAAIRMFRDRGLNIQRTYQRVEACKDDEKMEIDILCVNDKDILAIEVKSTLSVEDVRDHIERLKKFKHFFPEHEDKNVMGAVAGIVMDGNSDKFAYKQGLFVIGQTGETVRILNDEKFKPKAW